MARWCATSSPFRTTSWSPTASMRNLAKMMDQRRRPTPMMSKAPGNLAECRGALWSLAEYHGAWRRFADPGGASRNLGDLRRVSRGLADCRGASGNLADPCGASRSLREPPGAPRSLTECGGALRSAMESAAKPRRTSRTSAECHRRRGRGLAANRGWVPGVACHNHSASWAPAAMTFAGGRRARRCVGVDNANSRRQWLWAPERAHVTTADVAATVRHEAPASTVAATTVTATTLARPRRSHTRGGARRTGRNNLSNNATADPQRERDTSRFASGGAATPPTPRSTRRARGRCPERRRRPTNRPSRPSPPSGGTSGSAPRSPARRATHCGLLRFCQPGLDRIEPEAGMGRIHPEFR